MRSPNSFVMSVWHEPHVWGMFERKMEDFGSTRDLRLWLPWQLVQEISPVIPWTLLLNSSRGMAAPRACCLTNSISEWQRLQVLSILDTWTVDLGFLPRRIPCFP